MPTGVARAREDRGEHILLMYPLLLSQRSKIRHGILDLALDLTAKSAALCRTCPPGLLSALSDLIRTTNCYCSNLIESHHIHPVDIERAVKTGYNQHQKNQNLQSEARAHVQVQRWIDSGGLGNGAMFTLAGICEVHRRFCEALPGDLLWVDKPSTKERLRITPGELRQGNAYVGDLIAISPGALPRFLAHFEQIYAGLAQTDSIVANAAAYHRLLWMHPFLYGNGHVARLVSHAAFLELLGTAPVWSLARGLARHLQLYQDLLAGCNLPPQDDLDGRGSLSEAALADFTRFFLNTCIDQLEFIQTLIQPATLRARILQWAETETRQGVLPARAPALLEAILYCGELAPADADTVLGVANRQALRVVSALLDRHVLVSDTPGAPLRLAFPAALANLWMPGLFPAA